MSNILNTIAENNKKLLVERKKEKSLEEIKKEALKILEIKPSFKEALSKEGISIIGELKKASPSKGIICEDFKYLDFAKEYEKNKISAISCLTEPKYFMGSLEILNDVSNNVNTPILRKDFIIDPYQIYEAKVAGASAVLLIVSLLNLDELTELLNLAHSLNLDALVEVHSKEEALLALEAGADIIGINNRNLKDFTVDLNTTLQVAKSVPNDKILVSESGIHSKEDIEFLNNANINAVLIGEELMSNNISKTLERLR